MADEPRGPSLTAIEADLSRYPSAAFRARLRAALGRAVEGGQTMTTGTLDTGTIAGRRTETGLRTGLREGFTAVTPYVMVQDVDRLIAFIKDTFGAEETARATGSAGGTHCELRLGDSMLMVGGGLPPEQAATFQPRHAGLHVYVDDADAVYQRAVAAGAETLRAPADLPYGERASFVKDPTGNEWYIATHTGPSYSEEGLRSVTSSVRVRGAGDFVEFLVNGLGGRVEVRHDAADGSIVHAVLRVDGAAVELGDARPGLEPLTAAFYLYLPDCDARFAQAVAAGATVLSEPADMPYGDRMGGVRDAWGNEWYLATRPARG